MSRLSRIALALFALVGSGCMAHVAQGFGYHLPIPDGFAERSDPDLHLPPGAVVLAQTHRTAPDYFIGSIVITPVAASTPPFDPTNEALCLATGQALASRQAATLIKSGLVTTPLGKTCQVDVQSTTSNQAARLTVMPSAKALWALTCNHDPRDTGALEACQVVIDGWKFE